MITQKLFKNQLPFTQELAEQLKDLNERVINDFASLLIIDGGLGQGKTTLAVHAADYINSLHDKGPCNLDVQLALGGSDFLKKFRKVMLERYPVLIYDEAGDFNKRGSLTRFNAMLNRVFETFRGFRVIVILSLPAFYVIDQDIFDKNIPRLLLHLKNRGKNYGNYVGYSLYRMLYVKKNMLKMTVKAHAYSITHPNFGGHFYDLNKSRSSELDRISTKNKKEVLKQSYIKIQGLVSYKEIAQRIGRSTIYTKQQIAKLKIKHVSVVDRAKYFKEDVIGVLIDNMADSKTRGNR